MDASTTTAGIVIDDAFTIYRAAELHVALQATCAGLAAGTALRIDLAGVTEMDSAGVQLLLAARKTALAQGRALELTAPSPAVLDVFRALALESTFAAAAAA